MRRAIYNFLINLSSHFKPKETPVMYLYRNRNNEDIALQAISYLTSCPDDKDVDSIKITYNLRNEDNPKEAVFSK